MKSGRKYHSGRKEGVWKRRMEGRWKRRMDDGRKVKGGWERRMDGGKKKKGVEKQGERKRVWTPASVCLRGESVLLACTHDPPQTKQAQTKTLTTSKNSCDKHIELFS